MIFKGNSLDPESDLNNLQNKRDSVSLLWNEFQVVCENFNSNLISLCNQLKDDLSEIATNSEVEENNKRLFIFWLSRIVQKNLDFTAEEEIEIFQIANQCPDQGGKAVYSARSIYNSYLGNNFSFEDNNCDNQGTERKKFTKNDENKTFVVFPNPTMGEIFLRSSENNLQSGT